MNVYIRAETQGRADWHEIDAADLDHMYCCDCGEPAERITDASRYRDGSVLWGQCQDCAFETRAVSCTANNGGY